MKKRVKGGIEKHYCDKCGKLIYDHIPKKPTVKLFGQWLPEVTSKKYCDYKMEWGNKKRGIEAGEYCKECYDKMWLKQ